MKKASIDENYWETLGAAVHAFKERIKRDGGEFLAEGPIDGAFYGGVSYGQTVSKSFELVTLKGKATKKWAHISLYRMDSGRYELTSYIL